MHELDCNLMVYYRRYENESRGKWGMFADVGGSSEIFVIVYGIESDTIDIFY